MITPLKNWLNISIWAGNCGQQDGNWNDKWQPTNPIAFCCQDYVEESSVEEETTEEPVQKGTYFSGSKWLILL